MKWWVFLRHDVRIAAGDGTRLCSLAAFVPTIPKWEQKAVVNGDIH
jgi:hypothetical protein